MYVLCHYHGSQGGREHNKGRGGADKQGRPMRADQATPFLLRLREVNTVKVRSFKSDKNLRLCCQCRLEQESKCNRAGERARPENNSRGSHCLGVASFVLLAGGENEVPSWMDNRTEGREESQRAMLCVGTCTVQELIIVITNGEEKIWGRSTKGHIQHTELAAVKETGSFDQKLFRFHEI